MTTIHRVHADDAQPFPKNWLVAPAAAVTGFGLGLVFWEAVDHYLIVSAALIGFFALGRIDRATAFLLSLGYRLAISLPIVAITQSMLSWGTLTSYSGWVLLCFIESLPILLLRGDFSGWRAVLVFLLYLVPPFGTLSPANPDFVMGLLFPNSGWIGIVLTVAVVWAIAEAGKREAHIVGMAMLLISMAMNVLWETTPVSSPSNWHSLTTEYGNFGADISRRQAIANLELPLQVQRKLIEASPSSPSLWFLPEGMIHDKAAITEMTWSLILKNAKATAVVGEYFRNDDESMRSGVRILGAERPDTAVLGQTKAAVTAPGTMWHPWDSVDHFPLGLPNQTVLVDDHWLHMSWCMESTIIWPHFTASLRNRPDVMVSIENRWMTKGTSLEGVHNATALLNARWLGAALLRSINY